MTRILTIAQAEAQRYGPLTNTYNADEKWMQLAVEEDMRRGNITYALVPEVAEKPNEFAVWRKGMVHARPNQINNIRELREMGLR